MYCYQLVKALLKVIGIHTTLIAYAIWKSYVNHTISKVSTTIKIIKQNNNIQKRGENSRMKNVALNLKNERFD